MTTYRWAAGTDPEAAAEHLVTLARCSVSIEGIEAVAAGYGEAVDYESAATLAYLVRDLAADARWCARKAADLRWEAVLTGDHEHHEDSAAAWTDDAETLALAAAENLTELAALLAEESVR